MRQRTLKPGFFKNEDLSAMSPHERLLFIGLLLLADREGRFEDRPARIRAEVFPYETVLDIEEQLSALESNGFIRRYSAHGKRYGCIPKFVEHQHPHPKEIASVIPPPVESNGNAVESNGATMERPSVPSGSSIPSGSSGQPPRYIEPLMPNPTPVPAWESKAMAVWSKYLGGENDYIYADLVPVVRKFGEAKALAAWEAYCDAQAGEHGGKYASARSFAQKPGPWMYKAPDGPRHRTIAELKALEGL